MSLFSPQCGGVSSQVSGTFSDAESSPQCGGVPIEAAFSFSHAVSSPRKWGCFQISINVVRETTVFSTGVEVKRN